MDGDRETAFRRLVDERGDALARTAYLLTGDWHLAEDLVQSALATTWAHWRTLRDPGAAEAYARRCMARTCSAWWRGFWRREVVSGEVPDREGEPPYDAVDIAITVNRALALLTSRQRAMLVLRYFDDLSEMQVAEALGCTVGTVKSTVARALARLRSAEIWDGAGEVPA